MKENSNSKEIIIKSNTESQRKRNEKNDLSKEN